MYQCSRASEESHRLRLPTPLGRFGGSLGGRPRPNNRCDLSRSTRLVGRSRANLQRLQQSTREVAVVIPTPCGEDVNPDGKANLDPLSSVKYGKELLNEQLIPSRYRVPVRRHIFTRKHGKKSDVFAHTSAAFASGHVAWEGSG